MGEQHLTVTSKRQPQKEHQGENAQGDVDHPPIAGNGNKPLVQNDPRLFRVKCKWHQNENKNAKTDAQQRPVNLSCGCSICFYL